MHRYTQPASVIVTLGWIATMRAMPITDHFYMLNAAVFYSGTSGSLVAGVARYHAVQFTDGGITLRLQVSEGGAECYISDIVMHPGYNNRKWQIRLNGRGYADGFINPIQHDGLAVRYIYIAVTGIYDINRYLLTSTPGDFTTQSKRICDKTHC